MRKNILVILLLNLIVFGCDNQESNSDPSMKESLETALKTLDRQEMNLIENDMSQFKGLLIIPNAGCDGCINSAESFALKNYDKYPDLLIVFTRVGSMKALRVRSGGDILSSKSTYIDSNLIFSKDSLNSVYPIIAHLNSLKVTKIEEQSPFNTGALSRLLEYLD